MSGRKDRRGNPVNEWMLVGIVVVGSVLALGGGGWFISKLRGNKKPTA